MVMNNEENKQEEKEPKKEKVEYKYVSLKKP